MRRVLFQVLLAISSVCIAVSARADVIVAPEVIKTAPKQAVTVLANRMAIFELGSLDTGEAVGLQVDVANAMYKDLSVFIVDAPNMALARQNLQFRPIQGVTKKVAPFKVMAKISALGPYYVVFDNRFAAVIDKKVVYQVAYVKRLSTAEIEATKARFTKAYAGLKQLFEFKDFNIHVRSCGQANAFSTRATGDVTLCTEMQDELASRPGAMTAIIFHELGHTLLNLWGHPSYRDEDVADQFALNMLLRFGDDRGKQAISEWMQWFAEQNSQGEARHMLINGDTHSLSIQRVRNIQADMQDSADLMRRWNNILYPNMTDGALRAVIARPAPFDNAEAATRELQRRGRR